VTGLRVGSWTDPVGLTGCTAVLCPPGTIGSGEVRGGAPGTRETDLLRPGMLVEEVNAVLLTGGSAFGLAAADGVVRFLEERGTGFDTGVARVPIVPAAVLFDLAVGDPAARPGPEAGHAAAAQATDTFEEGNVGAGTGATVGPGRRLKGGLGTASSSEGDLVVGALVAVNAYGMVLDEQGEPFLPIEDEPAPPFPGTNSVVGVVATNAALSKERAHLLALAGHDGIAAAVRPAHTIFDGDTVFSLATGTGGTDAPQKVLEELVERTVAQAIRSGVRHASSVAGIPSAQDLGEG
jgi:L-aminopeptidase/D-esterase-like protein